MSAAWNMLVRCRRNPQLLTLEEPVHAAGVHPDLVEGVVDFGVLAPVERHGPRPLFDTAAVLRVRAIQRVRRDLGVNLPGMAVILDVTERLRTRPQELHGWRSRS
jgi:hypothetical protein